MNNKRVISVFMLAMINVAAICNVANVPFMSQFGFTSLFYYLAGALIFFIPVGLISAELATGWPKRGGVYAWVREALGERLGFIAIWMQWAENVFWYPTILSYTAATIAYIISPSLAQNRLYVMITILIAFWGMTFLNFLGMKVSGWISTICVVIGIFIPASIIILMGISWLIMGNPSEISFSFSSFLPQSLSVKTLSTFAGILVIFGGLEMSAVHAKEVEDPQRNFPKAIGLSTILIIFTLSMVALSIATVVPKEKIELASGAIEAIRYFLEFYNISWILPILAVLMTIGALGMVSTWLIGPTRGLHATTENGDLPPILQKANKRGIPVNILIMQGVIVTIISMVFLYSPTVSASYYLLFYLTAQAYLIMYILLFISAIVLRYKKPDVKRTYRVPFGNVGMWVVASLGLFASIIAMIFGFIPPENYKNPTFFTISLLISTAVFVLIPIIIHSKKHESWNNNNCHEENEDL